MLLGTELNNLLPPSLSKLEPLETDAAPAVPDGIKPLGVTKCFRVTDIVHTLPAGVWDSNVISTYEFSNVADGVFVRIRSPLSVVMDTVWRIEGPPGRLELVEQVTVRCSRLLLPIVKSQLEGVWTGIHKKMIARVVEMAEGKEGGKTGSH